MKRRDRVGLRVFGAVVLLSIIRAFVMESGAIAKAYGLVQPLAVLRLPAIMSWLYSIIFGALRSLLSWFVRRVVGNAHKVSLNSF